MAVTADFVAGMSPANWVDFPCDPVDDWDVIVWGKKTYVQMILDIAAEAERLVGYREKYGAVNQFTLNQWDIFHEFCNIFTALASVDAGSKAEIRLAEWEMGNALSRNDCDKAFDSIGAYWDQYLRRANTVSM